MTRHLREDWEITQDQLSDVVDMLRGKRIFFTGGTGFFGKSFLEAWNPLHAKWDLQSELVLLTRDPEAFQKAWPGLCGPSVRLHAGDVRTFEFPSGSFDYVIHAATPASVTLNASSPLVMLDTIIEGTRRVLEFSRRSGVKRLLFTSSGAAYGRQDPAISHLTEEQLTSPDTQSHLAAYGEGKRVAELLCHLSALDAGFTAVTARCFAFVGPHLPLDGTYAMGNFIRDALAGKAIAVQGDGTPLRSYLYSADLVAWLCRLLLKGQNGRIYNVGSDQPVTIRQLAEKIAAAVEPKLQVNIARKPTPGTLPERYIPSIERIRTELGLNPQVGLDEAIARTIDWHRQH